MILPCDGLLLIDIGINIGFEERLAFEWRDLDLADVQSGCSCFMVPLGLCLLLFRTDALFSFVVFAREVAKR